MQANPIDWAKAEAVAKLTWPALVFAAYYLGRKVTQIEQRLAKAESQLDNLNSKHMPALYRALGEIRSLIMYKGR
jgi:hypothetical protein